MVITKTSGEIISTKRGTSLTFVKVGTPGSRRWNVVLMRKGSKKVEQFPVREVGSIKGGSMKLS